MSLSDVFRNRYYIPGWCYIQGSKSEQLLKFGITANLRQRTQRNIAQKYGGIGDWELLYKVWVENCGRVETDALGYLQQYKVSRTYLKDGVSPQTAREIVSCDFSVAVEAIEKCLSEDERANAWQSANTYFYEFSVRSKEYMRSLYRREILRAPIGMPQKSLWFLEVKNLDLSVRSENSLLNNGVKHVGTLIQKSEWDLLRIPNFGRKSLNEIKDVLSRLGLSLGTQIANWPPNNLDVLSERIAPFLSRVDDLELSVRSINNLHREDIFYLGELVKYSESEMLGVLKFDRKSLTELRNTLAELGLRFGMDFLSAPDLAFAS